LMQLAGIRASFDADAVAGFIQGCQKPNGMFGDPAFDASDLVGSHSPDYIEWQFTFFALVALDGFGVTPTYPLVALEPLRASETALDEWLASREWGNFWYCSNEIMFLLYFLTYCHARGGATEDRARALHILDWLDERQDEETGFWGDGVRSQPANGLYVFLFYDYYDRPIRHADAGVRHTLQCQHAAGLFGGIHGGACEDYDAVDVLLRLQRHAENSSDVRAALQRVHARLRACNGPTAFSYALTHNSPKGFVSRCLLRVKGLDTYRYSGWPVMASHLFRSDLWSVYFRTLTLGFLEDALGEKRSLPYAFYDLPGWGYAAPSTEVTPCHAYVFDDGVQSGGLSC
jgi:hypothetical protein